MDEDDRRCIVCGASDTTRWTLDNGASACITDLCTRDAAQLVLIMEATEGIPPSRQQRPASPEEGIILPPRTRVPKLKRMEPLDWEPPTAS
jgi:hypothetical protein